MQSVDKQSDIVLNLYWHGEKQKSKHCSFVIDN